MQKGNVKLAAVAAVVIVVILLASWQMYDDRETMSDRYADGILDMDFEKCYDMLSDEAKAAFGSEDGYKVFYLTITSTLSGLETQYGAMTSKGDSRSYEFYGNYASETVIFFQHGAARVMVYSADNVSVDGFYFFNQDLQSNEPLPKGINEKDVEVGIEGAPTLDGKISYSKDSDHKVAAVLVHGSGSHSMNESMGDNHIFQQIAWGLSEKGIDVLRYDKRTYAYSAETVALGPFLDINYEKVGDAVAAGKMLKEMGYEKVYVIGHSLGAMMAPAIVYGSDGAYDGMISLAGSPRDLAQIQYDQNMDAISTLPDGAEKDYALTLVNAEYQKYLNIGSMSQEELLTTTIFGMTAYYHKSMMNYQTSILASHLDVPMLFMQGWSDWQVSLDDYRLWQAILAGNEDAQFEEFPGLNHIFAIPGEHAGTVQEYTFDVQTVNSSVIDRIASFILG